MNTIERTKAKLERLERVSAECIAEFEPITASLNSTKNNLFVIASKGNSSDNAIVKVYLNKVDRLLKLVNTITGVNDNE